MGVKERFPLVERKYRELHPGSALPWDNGACPVLATSYKVMYMEVMLLHLAGYADVTFLPAQRDAPGVWHGIQEVTVDASHREGARDLLGTCLGLTRDLLGTFPAPILFGCQGNQLWKTLGFTLTRRPDGVWHYVFDSMKRCNASASGVGSVGRGVEPWAFTSFWAEKRLEVETRYLELYPLERLPWHGVPSRCMNTSVAGRPRMGNASKVLFMELEMHRRDGVLEMQKADPPGSGLMWHDIQRFIVPRDKRPIFDAGNIPSQVSCASDKTGVRKYKTVYRIWRTFGMSELTQSDGSLLFVCTEAAVASAQRVDAAAAKKARTEPPNALDMLATCAAPASGK
jgi:hypothetical protein